MIANNSFVITRTISRPSIAIPFNNAIIVLERVQLWASFPNRLYNRVSIRIVGISGILQQRTLSGVYFELSRVFKNTANTSVALRVHLRAILLSSSLALSGNYNARGISRASFWIQEYFNLSSRKNQYFVRNSSNASNKDCNVSDFINIVIIRFYYCNNFCKL